MGSRRSGQNLRRIFEKPLVIFSETVRYALGNNLPDCLDTVLPQQGLSHAAAHAEYCVVPQRKHHTELPLFLVTPPKGRQNEQDLRPQV